MFSDLRSAFRGLARHRSFALVTVSTLALGIGSAAAIFTVTDWILFRAAQFPADVFLVGGQNDNIGFMPYRSDFMTRVYEEQASVLSEFAKAASMTGNVVVDGQPVATNWIGVSTGFFPLLGIVPNLGRGFLPGEDTEGSDHVVVVSHAFWQEHLGGRLDAIGRKIMVGDAVCTVVGVLREAQNLPAFASNDIFRPLAYHIDPERPWLPYLYLMVRLRSEITREGAQRALQTIRVEWPSNIRQYCFNDRPVLSSLTEVNRVRRPEIYWLLLGAVGFLYAIACLNASNLMLIRMLGQSRELSIRLALGGGRWRILRLLSVESLALALLASLAGALVAQWIFPLLLNVGRDAAFAPHLSDCRFGWRDLGAMAALTVSTSLLIVAIPAARILRIDIYAGLKDGGSAVGENVGLARLHGALIIVQAAFAVILLAGAGLMVNTIHHLQKVDLGFDPAGRVKVQLGFPLDYPSAAEPRLARLRQIQTHLAQLEGVRAVGFGMDVILPGYYVPTYNIEGPDRRPIKAAMAGFNIGYQDAAGLVLKRGHWLNQSTGSEIMVNESFARACWSGADPVGQLVRPVDGSPVHGPGWKGWVVAGVVGDVRSTTREVPGNYLYGPEGWGPEDFDTFIVRSSRPYDEAFASLVRRELYAFDPRIVVNQIVPLDRLRDNSLWAERMADSVLKALAGIALILTLVGIFSVIAYTVDRRKGEFGVRLAIGATPRQLVALVMQRGMILALSGVVLGIGGGLALTRYLRSLLFETSAQDPWVLGAVGVIVLLVSSLACSLPAWNAAKVSISQLLRSE